MRRRRPWVSGAPARAGTPRNDESAGSRGEGGGVAVVRPAEGALRAEGAAVDVHDKGEPAAGRGGSGGEEEARRHAGAVVNDDVPRGHPEVGCRVLRRGDERTPQQPLDAAVLVP